MICSQNQNIVILIYGEKLEINFSPFFLHNILLVLRTEEGFCRVFPAGSKISLSSLSPLEGKGKLYSLTFFGAKKKHCSLTFFGAKKEAKKHPP